ncbi:hypothetical protein M3J07_004264 [Ascochyta lentis]
MTLYYGTIGAASKSLYRDLGDNEIRLLHLHPSRNFDAPIYTILHTAKSSDSPAYRALSYVWGDPRITSTISVNGADFEVTTNLASALRHLRKERAVTVLWVDAICINQPDVGERNHQVQMMARIYKSAQEVIAWLGERENNSDEAMGLLRRWGSALASSGINGYKECTRYVTMIRSRGGAEAFFATIEDPFPERAWTALCDLYKRDYWKRLWIVQEFVLAKKVTLVCGFDRVAAQHLLTEWIFCECIPFLAMADQIASIWNTLDRVNKERYLVHDLLKWQDRVHRYGEITDTRLLRLLFDMTFRNCTDPRDHLFGASGFCTEKDPQIVVNYSLDLNDASVAFACRCITRSYFEILCFAGIGYRQQLSTPSFEPSWVPDWSATGRSRGNSYHPGLFEYTGYSAGGRRPGASMILDAGSHSTTIGISGAVISTVEDVLEGGTKWEDPYDTRWRTLLLKNECRNTYLNSVPMLQAYLRTLLADLEPGFGIRRLSAASRLDESGSPRDFVVNFLKQYCFIGRELDPEEQIALLARTPLDEIMHPWKTGHFFQEGEEWNINTWLQCIQKAHKRRTIFLAARSRGSSRRSFFTTSNGYIGTGPPYAKPGDVVCIVQGANVPFLLRSHKDGYLLVGEAFVLGLMDGEYKGDFGMLKLY